MRIIAFCVETRASLVVCLLVTAGLLASAPLASSQSPSPSPAANPAPTAPPFSLPFKGDIKIPITTSAMPESPATSGSIAAPETGATPKTSGSVPAPAATPSPEFTPRQAVDSLSDADTQQALDLLRSSYVNSSALTEDALNRAMLQGLLERLGAGVKIQPAGSREETQNSPFRAEILDDRIGYTRIGSLTKDHLAEFDASLGNFTAKGLNSLIIDLRATPPSTDFDLAGEFIKRLSPKGKVLFAVHRPSVKQEQMFTSNQDPAFRGVIVTLVNHKTAGAGELIAAVLRTLDNALVVGQKTAGQAAEFTELPLHGGKILRLAVAQVTLPQGPAIFPDGLKPDLVADVSASRETEALRKGLEKGVSGLVFETERVRLNEAALMAGTNPELDEVETAQKTGGVKHSSTLTDPALQRAVDVISTIQIFGPKETKK